jgi:hypothetical protein
MRNPHPRKNLALALGIAGAVALGLIAGRQPAWTDDRDLLRTQGAVPYVFFMLDTSYSMNQDVFNNPLPLSGDDPSSKLYLAKEALYQVFEDANDFHFGFATYNQDQARVRYKHWLYQYASGSFATDIGWPAAGDQMVFGPHLRDASNVELTTAGSCGSPLRLGSARQRINRFAKLGLTSLQTTEIWIQLGTTGNTDKYRVRFKPAAVPTLVGSPTLDVQIERTGFSNSTNCTGESTVTADFSFTLIQDFVMQEANRSSASKGGGSVSVGGQNSDEDIFGYWDWVGGPAFSDCGSGPGQPFTGKGWDGNYDRNYYVDRATSTLTTAPADIEVEDDVDHIASTCSAPLLPATCYNLRTQPTLLDPRSRVLDYGDLIPYDWDNRYKDDFLRRLNPNHLLGDPDFGISSYFLDTPDAVTGLLHLRPGVTNAPLLGAAGSPLAKAINDYRCWYQSTATGQCRNARYEEKWQTAAQRIIGNEAQCVQPYLIVITDAENTCGGESPASDVAAMKAQGNVKTWVLALAEEGSASGVVSALAQAGGGELIYVQTKTALQNELQRIRGLIEEQARTFASAAVPTVQATVEDKIYLSNFVPLNDKSFWSGEVHSFLKPLPLNPDTGRPDTTHENHLWEAGAVMKTSQLTDPPLGSAETKRRVYYSRLTDDDGNPTSSGGWGAARRLLEAPEPPNAGEPATEAEKDLWRGLGLSFTEGDVASEDVAREAANEILAYTFSLKSATLLETEETITYLLGDIFHSDPVIVGAPSNFRFFAADLHGYRDFARRHENRRKLLLVGANDGMLHAFDAGKADIDNALQDVRFDNGSGKELFAFVPRPQLDAMRKRSDNRTQHQWGVDGSIKIFDAFVDPVHEGAPDPDEREWRTLLVGGLREGGAGYYALDITQPDPLEERTAQNPFTRQVILPPTTAVVPGCHAATGGGGDLECHPELEWPSVRWEFDDTVYDAVAGARVRLNEDFALGNALPDLANTWSIPNLGRIRVCNGSECLPSIDPDNPDDIEDRYVAIFGGGLPGTDRSLWSQRGNWIYMVDVETGETLYKRRVSGAVPAEVAAVDTTLDGYIDRIYFGTTGGGMYRIDLVEYKIEDGARVQRPFPTSSTPW